MDITPYLHLLRDKNGSDLFFTVGAPVDDRRLTTEPGYAWEQREPSFRR